MENRADHTGCPQGVWGSEDEEEKGKEAGAMTKSWMEMSHHLRRAVG